MNHKMRLSDEDIVFTGLGMITANGCGFEEHHQALLTPQPRTKADDYYVRGFNPAPYLSDRKVVKVVSKRDVLGLVAFETCLKDAGITKESCDADRTGLYVGAPPSACTDSLNYAEGIEETRDVYGKIQERKFGSSYRTASPTTLLNGLPNNVLCYGSKTLDARGPNSNYTALETSAHLSIIGASRAMRMGRLDCAIAGGYSAHNDPMYVACMDRRGLLKKELEHKTLNIEPFSRDDARNDSTGTVIAEGAVFTAMELRGSALLRGAKPFATLLAAGMASDAKGPFAVDSKHSALSGLIRRVLKQAGLQSKDIEIVLLNGCGIVEIEAIECGAIEDLFAKGDIPTLLCTSRVWGNLMEAGGVAELGLLKNIYETGLIPMSTRVDIGLEQRAFRQDRRHAIILRASPWGEYSCLCVRMDEENQP